MMRSMFAGVSGLKAHQTRMDIIGNNIANVNSAGYKSSRATFQDMLSQTLRAATAPTSARGGTNPHQVGLGVSLGSIDVKHTQGNTQSTGYLTDLAIEGDGFFVLGEGQNRIYTRAGMFGLDNGTEGNLVSLVNGQRVLGYKADQNGKIDHNSPLEALYISASDTISPRATSEVYFAGNLDNRYSTDPNINPPVSRTVQVFDSRGREQTIIVEVKKLDGNNWEWTSDWLLISDPIRTHNAAIEPNREYVVDKALLDPTDPSTEVPAIFEQDDDGNPTGSPVAKYDANARAWVDENTQATFQFERMLNQGDKLESASTEGLLFLTLKHSLNDATTSAERTIKFNTDGSFSGVDHYKVSFKPSDADDLVIELDFSAFTQYADTFTGKFMSQNGYANGALESYAIDQNGTIIGSFSNGLTRALGQVALARFTNPAGLQRAGATMFVDTPNSGTAQIGAGGQPGYGTIAPSSLEMSNVDLSEEFTDMIVTQRGFQANSRIITSSDEMLQELVNLKR